MFHPVLVVTLFCLERDMSLSRDEGKRTHVWEVFTSMSTTRLFMGSGRGDSLDGALEDIAQFRHLHEIPTSYIPPNQNSAQTVQGDGAHASQITLLSLVPTLSIKVFIDGANLLDTFVESSLGP
jgi:hypothetical protein